MNVIMKPLKMVPGGVGPLLAIFSILFYVPTHAQIAIRGVINSYAAVTGFDVCANKLNVASTAGFQPGNVVMLIQMQGATINESNSSAYGSIAGYNNAGNFEKAVIAEIQGNTISFTKDLIKTYDANGKVQMVSIPQYGTGTVIVLSELTAAPWNGTTGGVLAFEAIGGTVDVRANINVNGKGFRGGGITLRRGNGNNCNPFFPSPDYYYGSDSWESAFKGEGIAEVIAGKELGRGSQANGGGGGNDHNSGGGGGAHAALGGNGGENREPALDFAQCRGYNPGLGGRPLQTTELIFMGGGGGGGHSNNENAGTAGANGGGIVYIAANQLIGNSRVISANGNNAIDGLGDGVGGGGAGGTIILNINQVNAQDLQVQVKGGNGANVDNLGDDRCFGPGGGGSGGVIALSDQIDLTEITADLTGGIPGITLNSTSELNCSGSSNGATAGGNGIVRNSVFVPTGLLDPGSGCFTPTPVDYLYFKLQPQDNMVHLEWATAREKDNDYFSIERSENGKDFYEIARVSGKGTYNGVSTYTINDNNPLFGLSYYRIKQVDYDRKSAYTGIEPVRFSAGEMLLSVYPNPVQSQDNLNISIYSPLDGEATLRIYTLLGEEKYTATYGVTKGAQKLDLPMNNFSTGWYVIHLQIGNYYKVHKIKVVR